MQQHKAWKIRRNSNRCSLGNNASLQTFLIINNESCLVMDDIVDDSLNII